LKTIPSNSLFFIVDKDKHLKPCGGEYELEKDLGGPSMALDMTKLREFNGQLVATPSALNTCCSPDCCGLKVVIVVAL